ncbi:MAG: hypothetical protein IPH77_15605 [Ignavibacteria bacterium]|nr:hypothetical protein [Ignavibacteria bacterium]
MKNKILLNLTVVSLIIIIIKCGNCLLGQTSQSNSEDVIIKRKVGMSFELYQNTLNHFVV